MKTMKTLRALVLAGMTGAVLVSTGCSVIRGQQSASSYVDDATITANIKAKMVESKAVDAGAVSVETLNGEVSLSGFAQSAQEKASAGEIARSEPGVRTVHNDLVVRPAAN
mgnify:CR=1 FL=1